ncbi:unnamed protein product [marine sediment metagenome]|uniref:Uncharacterized protein n=1 Tax=marine sediment metagenome TaxID=412755 RepID=X1LMX2_9ZZZZ
MKPTIYSIIKITAGHFHCWCESSVGRIRKENKNVPQDLWDKFEKFKEVKLEKKLKWYARFWNWIKIIFRLKL